MKSDQVVSVGIWIEISVSGTIGKFPKIARKIYGLMVRKYRRMILSEVGEEKSYAKFGHSK